MSDQYLGKYNTILYFSFVYTAGVLILVCTALPTAIEHGAALGGLIAAMVRIPKGAEDAVTDAIDRSSLDSAPEESSQTSAR